MIERTFWSAGGGRELHRRVGLGVATFLMGLLPTYDMIGIWAPILLIVLRFIQAIGVGGEWGTAW